MTKLPAFLCVTVAICCTLRAEDEKPAAGKQVAQSVEVAADKGGKTTLHYWLALPPQSEKSRTRDGPSFSSCTAPASAARIPM
jgi:hypothetical protein